MDALSACNVRTAKRVGDLYNIIPRIYQEYELKPLLEEQIIGKMASGHTLLELGINSCNAFIFSLIRSLRLCNKIESIRKSRSDPEFDRICQSAHFD
jgi:hypothetical protein